MGLLAQYCKIRLRRMHTALVEVHSELLGRAYAVLQDRVIDIYSAHLIGVERCLVPHVLDPQDRKPRLRGELPPHLLSVREWARRRRGDDVRPLRYALV